METNRGSRIENDHVTIVITNNPILCSDGSNRESRIEDGAVVAVEPIMRGLVLAINGTKLHSGDALVNEIQLSNNVMNIIITTIATVIIFSFARKEHDLQMHQEHKLQNRLNNDNDNDNSDANDDDNETFCISSLSNVIIT